MEPRNTQTAPRQTADFSFESYDSAGDELALQRLEKLIAINTETAREKAMFRTEKEKLEAQLMENPVSTGKVFSYFGLMLGLFPPAAIFTRFFMESGNFHAEDSWIIGVLLVVNLLTAVTGFLSGKFIAKMIATIETYSWFAMLLLVPFIGIFWGVMAGGAGGIVILIFGAIFGALVGALVGGVALPIFTIFHRLMKKGHSMELKYFLPVSLGITFSICSFILGM